MTKTFLVAGSNWVAEVDIVDVETLSLGTIKMEAATKAIEALFKKRDDVEIDYHEPIVLTQEQKDSDNLHCKLVELLTDEIEPGCGVGMVLCIMDNQDPDKHKAGEDHEWFVSSKTILENAGMPMLAQKFDERRLVNS